MAISSDGFVPARRTARPAPRPATLGDFISKNAFAELASGAAASTGDDDNRGVVSHPPSPGYASTTSPTIRASTTSPTTRKTCASRIASIPSTTVYEHATKATAKAYFGETGGRRATTDNDHNGRRHDDDHDVRLVGPSKTSDECRDVRGDVLPPPTSLRQAKRHGADTSA